MKRVALLSICLALSAQTSTRDIVRAHDAGDRFATAWNDWARQHDRNTVSRADKERFRKVRKAWKEFDSLYKLVE